MRVGEADAMGSIFGYINFVDGSARGLPPERNTYYQMKARETFAPIGPYIVTAILSLGTSHGGLNPFMDGDIIEQEVEGLGRLRFTIRDELKRTWAHESRDQRKQRGEKGVSPQLTGKYAKI
jgi:2-keto-4-pentenoate hydratase/2-oxohepta-3-ene-1,7-dioic acid hydratase in catechol pathway